ncbi:hypothetical protein [Lacipirellula sp.]|uniref:hypothetical protein n=1 Tax=Lacipirellula sp. TaxID=2691419 RepID=UPI003D0ED000
MLAATNPVAVMTIALVGGIVFGACGALIRGNRGFAVGFVIGAILVPAVIAVFGIMLVRTGIFAVPG